MKKKLIGACIAVVLCLASAAHTQDLFSAARSNDVSQAEKLIAANADVNAQDENGYTPLIFATYHDNYDVAALLLKHGAKPELTDHSGRTALMGACFKGYEREVTLLLNYGANPKTVDPKGFTSMAYAVMSVHLSVVRTLREYAANTDKSTTSLAANK